MIRRWLKISVAVLGLLVVLGLVGPDVLITVLVGWARSAARLFQAWHPATSGLVLFALAVLVLVVGSHAFLRWLHAKAQSHREGGEAKQTQWLWKWTLSGFGFAFCALLAIVSAVLTAHQVYWLANATDPWFVASGRERIQAIRVASDLQLAADRHQWDSAKTQTAFWGMGSADTTPPTWETFQPLWVAQDERTLRAVVLIPRRPMQRAAARLVVLRPGTNFTTAKLGELPQVDRKSVV
jgi:hypothetical protein